MADTGIRDVHETLITVFTITTVIDEDPKIVTCTCNWATTTRFVKLEPTVEGDLGDYNYQLMFQNYRHTNPPPPPPAPGDPIVIARPPDIDFSNMRTNDLDQFKRDFKTALLAFSDEFCSVTNELMIRCTGRVYGTVSVQKVTCHVGVDVYTVVPASMFSWNQATWNNAKDRARQAYNHDNKRFVQMSLTGRFPDHQPRDYNVVLYPSSSDSFLIYLYQGHMEVTRQGYQMTDNRRPCGDSEEEEHGFFYNPEGNGFGEDEAETFLASYEPKVIPVKFVDETEQKQAELKS